MGLQNLIQTGKYTLIDVREPIELEMDGSFQQAINIPIGAIEEQLQKIKTIEGPKILFCRSGGRSANAVQFLQHCGINDVYNGGGFGILSIMIQNSL